MEVGCRCIMQNQDNTKQPYAGFGVRFAAYVIDLFILSILLLFIRVPVFFATVFNPASPLKYAVFFRFTPIDIILYLLTATYFVLLTYLTGSTLGKMLMNIKVVNVDGSKLTFINILLRETIGRYLSKLILFIGYFMIGPDEEKRALHDRIYDTRVVYKFKIPVRVVEREPRKKYAWTWKVKEEFLDEYVKMHLMPWPEVLEAHHKAGYRNYSIFQNGNQFFYVFECDNLRYAHDFIAHNEACKKWNELTSQMVEGSFDFNQKNPIQYLPHVFYLK